MQHPAVSSGKPGCAARIQHKHPNDRLKTLAVFSHKKVAAVHSATWRAQSGAAAVLERFAGFEQRLMPHHAQTLDFFGVAFGVDDDPMA